MKPYVELTAEQIKNLSISRMTTAAAQARTGEIFCVTPSDVPAFSFVDVCGFFDEARDLLAVVAFEEQDKDFNVVVLARSGLQPYRAVDLAVSITTREAAEQRAREMLRTTTVSDAQRKLGH